MISIPENVGLILSTLNQHGYEAYIVGGCVRDSLLGRLPKDWDVTTSARPVQVKELFRSTYDTGIEHGTVSVRFGTEIYEVTTFRVDGDYSDHRHPDSVIFSENLTEDLKRRDFTMNAMAWHPDTGLIDLFGGEQDLRDGVIRCVGEAEERFEEDALRMLRAYRFAARFGFRLDEKAEEAIRIKASLLSRVSAERIREEMHQILSSADPQLLGRICESGLMRYIVPEWLETIGLAQNTNYHCYTVDEHTYQVMRAIPGDTECLLTMRWAAWLHDIAKPRCRRVDEAGVDHFKGHPQMGAEMTDAILRRLKFDNDSRQRIRDLVRWHDIDKPETEKQMRWILNRMPEGMYPMVLAIQRADALAKNPAYWPATEKQLAFAKELYHRVLSERQCVKLADLAVNGRDLLALGYPNGKKLGEALQALLEQVLEEPALNRRETLLEMAAKRLEKEK